MTAEDSLARIKEKLQRLRELDKGFRVEGAKVHRYRMNPCLNAQELAGFERRHGITLPEDYRRFLREVGNGGAGDEAGLHPLPLHARPDALPLNESFPITAAKARRILTRRAPEFVPQPISGCLRISEDAHGAHETLLVVNGELAGTVWYDVDSPSSGLVPAVHEDGSLVDFAGWYEGWLDQWLAPGALPEPSKRRKK
jgi:hypothetical protein